LALKLEVLLELNHGRNDRFKSSGIDSDFQGESPGYLFDLFTGSPTLRCNR
jgi:hypothetical protein